MTAESTSPTSDATSGTVSGAEAQSRRAFLSHARHELRTPLNAIIGYSEMLLEEEADAGGGPLTADLEKIHRAGARLLGLVSDILDAARIDALPEDELNLATFGRALDRDLRSPVEEVIVASKALLDGEPPVEDAAGGGGAARDELQRIHTSALRLLALVDHVVETTQSGNVSTTDEGATDVAQMVHETMSPDQPSALSEREDDGSATGHLLVVDDNETNRDLLSRRLEKQGYTVALAENGRQALDLVAARDFDLVLLDILMPGMNGIQVLQYLKSDDEHRHIPVIMISALDEMDSVVRCIEIGAEDYLPKPFNPVLLRARINASLEKKRLRDKEKALYDQLQENYSRLQELEELRDSLIHMVVHDLRTPLTSLMAGIQSMPILGPLNEKQTNFLNLSVRGGETLLNMITDLLDISKMEDGSMQLDYHDCDVTELCERTAQQVRELILAENQTLTIEVAPDLPAIPADEEKLRRTLVNLLGNAIKFTPRGGAIKILVAPLPAEGALRFSVEDTGEGIPEDAFQRIFDKFGQVETRMSGRKMSTGLGLTLCKMVAEAHGGRIWVESTLGQGSTFHFTIPTKRAS